MITIDPIKRPPKKSSSVDTTEIMKEVDLKIANLIGRAPETLDTLNELATAITEHQEVTDLLDVAIINKADKSEIPTKVSQLENDVPYALKSEIEVEIEVEVEVEDGVYAVTADNLLIDYNTADSSCVGVALIRGEHKFMIAKNDATDDGSNYNLYYDYDKGNLSLTNYSNADGTNGNGYLGVSLTPQLSQDFTTWTAGALSDFNGKTNTEAIAASSSNANDMCKVLETFNAGTNSYSNQGHTDWYVPACGQLALIYLANSDINTALQNIGGAALKLSSYWSSSKYDADDAWYVHFSGGIVNNGGKDRSRLVRFVRDLTTTITTTVKKPLKEKVSDLESQIGDINTILESIIND